MSRINFYILPSGHNMEAELKEILTQLLEGQTEIKSDFTYISNTITKIQSNQEQIKSHITTLAELYEAHAEEYLRSLESIDDLINENAELFQAALISTTKDLNRLKIACKY